MNAIVPIDELDQDTSEITWGDNWKLGYEPMDHIHEEFVDLLGQLQNGRDSELAGFMDQLIIHVKAHFEEEDKWMVETEFPPRDCHIEQHQQVLNSILEVRELLNQDRFDICRDLTRALVDWFPSHATHLDSALAHWMFKRKFGGKPVVIHKNIYK